ncbi:kinase-like domain-containing protein [Phycomyces nitens]|nr:kinase-like domain-containing protein [Phycomyces nitens]
MIATNDITPEAVKTVRQPTLHALDLRSSSSHLLPSRRAHPAETTEGSRGKHPKNSQDIPDHSIPTCKDPIDLTLPTEPLAKSVLLVMQKLFPSLINSSHQPSLERVSGAMTNAVFFVTVNKKRFLMRIYGHGCDQILDRENELAWLARLSHLGLGPRMLGIFGNGRFEEYLESTTLSYSDMRQPFFSKQIASRLCQLHTIVEIYPPSAKEARQLSVWQNVHKWLATIQDIMPNLVKNEKWAAELELFDIDLLREEIDICQRLLKTIQSPIIFGHNDTQYGNILKLDKTGELVVIDFEYAGYNTRGFEIANHFCEWMYDYHSDSPASMKVHGFPTQEEQKLFLKAYAATNNIKTPIDVLQKEALIWVMASHLSWGLWGLVQANQSEIDFDYFLYSMERLGAFRKELANWSLD